MSEGVLALRSQGWQQPRVSAGWLSFRPGHGLRKSPRRGPRSSAALEERMATSAASGYPRLRPAATASRPSPNSTPLRVSSGISVLAAAENPASRPTGETSGSSGSPPPRTVPWRIWEMDGVFEETFQNGIQRLKGQVSFLTRGVCSYDKTSV